MAKKLVFTTNTPSANTDYAAADGTWKPYTGGTGSTTWGSITGTLSSQTDLQSALNAKFDDPTGTTAQYIRGDGSLATFPTTSSIPHTTASGTDTYTASISGVTAYNDGDSYLVRFTNGNTTGCTLNINSLGAIDLYRNNDGALIGGDIIDGAEMLCIYNSSTNRFQVIGTAPNTLLAYVTNAETTTITKGQPVYAFGGTGDRLKVKLAYNTGDSTSAQTVGLVLSSSIAANQKGLIIVNGQLDGLSILPTSTFADGDPVYLGSTPGSITNVKPTGPNHLVYLGFVTTASPGSAGRMYVRVQNGYELDELHDVKLSTFGTKDVLWRDTSTNLWRNKDVFTLMGAASASANGYLSSTDWSTFNGKQNTVSLSNTGTSGASTFNPTTGALNIPVYAGAGSGTSIQTITGSVTGLAAGTTRYGSIGGTTAETQVSIPLASACTINNLYVRTTATMPANSSLQVTIFKNGSATAVTLTISAGTAAGIYSDTANNASFSAGDRYQIEFKNTGSAAAAPTSGQSFKITI